MEHRRKLTAIKQLSRRGFMVLPLRLAIGLPVCACWSVCSLSDAVAEGETQNPANLSIEAWMDSWMGATKAVGGPLHLSRFKEPIYFLTKPISWAPNPGQEALGEVKVPKGFVTDLTSVPRVFWSILRPDGEYTYPAIIHDYLYWTQITSRDKADLVFKYAMEDFGIGPVKLNAIYNAVRLGGGSAWSKNAEERSRGAKRILKKFPQDPRMTWDEWSERPGVFAP